MKNTGVNILDVQLYNFILFSINGEMDEGYWNNKRFFGGEIYDRRFSEWESFYYSSDRDILRGFFNEE